VTSIQQFLGHKQLNSTMIYARVHDHTVAEDYYTAIEQIEQRLKLVDMGDVKVPIGVDERPQLLVLSEQLAAPELTRMERLELVDQIRFLLTRKSMLE
jgi:hypothetical protein